MESGEHVQAQQLCLYKKAIASSTQANMQFDNEFRGIIARREEAYNNHTSLNDLQAHFHSLVVKAPMIVSIRPRNRGRFCTSNPLQPVIRAYA